MISPKHANFIENADGATSADCVALMVEARRRAREQFGVELEREVVFAGLPELPAAHVADGEQLRCGREADAFRESLRDRETPR